MKEHVTDPLSQLLQLFQAPFRLIQKRNDKCLDYDRAKNKAQRARDSKERDKINQVKEQIKLSKCSCNIVKSEKNHSGGVYF